MVIGPDFNGHLGCHLLEPVNFEVTVRVLKVVWRPLLLSPSILPPLQPISQPLVFLKLFLFLFPDTGITWYSYMYHLYALCDLS